MESSRNDVSYTCSVGFVDIDVFAFWTLVIHRYIVLKGKLVYFLETGKKKKKKTHTHTHFFFSRIWLIFPGGNCQTKNTQTFFVIFGFAFLFIFLCSYWFGFYWVYLKNSTYVKKVKKNVFQSRFWFNTLLFSLQRLLFIKRLSAFLPITDTPSSGCSNTSLVLQLLGYLHNCTCRFSFQLRWCLII